METVVFLSAALSIPVGKNASDKIFNKESQRSSNRVPNKFL